MSVNPQPEDRTPPSDDHDDVVSLVEHQHEQIRSLFGDLTGGRAADPEATFCELRRLLAVHETAEEEILYPYVRSFDGGDRIAEAREREEGQAKDRLAELESLAVDDPAFAERIAAFARMVDAHADAEERTVLALLRQSADADALDRMATGFRAAEAAAPTHPHPHGPDSALGNLVVGPFVAIADRVRDAIHQRSA